MELVGLVGKELRNGHFEYKTTINRIIETHR